VHKLGSVFLWRSPTFSQLLGNFSATFSQLFGENVELFVHKLHVVFLADKVGENMLQNHDIDNSLQGPILSVLTRPVGQAFTFYSNDSDRLEMSTIGTF
jgi:hypothetical protein